MLDLKQTKKPKCMLCYFVRIFALIAFVLVLIFVLSARFVPSASTIGF